MSGFNTGLTTATLVEDTFSANSSLAVFICHDVDGFFAMSARCPHASTNMANGGSYDENDLQGGFTCQSHSSTFDGNGYHIFMNQGPAPTGWLIHYLVTIEPGTGAIFLDTTKIVAPDCRCMP